VPPSRRPDGSVRKAIKIRPGFVAQEEIKPFKPSVIQRHNNTTSGVPGASIKSAQMDGDKKLTKAQKKKQKELLELIEAIKKEDHNEEQIVEASPVKEEPPAAPTKDDIEKKIKACKKKLRQIDDLKLKESQGVDLNAEQKEKLSKLPELQLAMDDLEAQLSSLSI
jgi:partner of Y14 and mago